MPKRADVAGEMQDLSLGECLTLLAGGHEGRIAIVADGQPAICPVNYVADGASIIFRTNWPMLGRASLASLAFQIAGADVDGRIVGR